MPARQSSRPVVVRAVTVSRPETADVTVGRVSGRAAFSGLRRSALSCRVGPLTVVSNPLDSADGPSVAYAISRRVGNAVVRNKVRRRLRELSREAVAAGLVAPGDHLVIAAPSAARRGYSQLRDDLFAAFAGAASLSSAEAGQ